MSSPPSAPILTKPPAIQYATQNVPPPAPLYVDTNDAILLQGLSSVAGVQVTLLARLLLPDGKIVPIQQTLSPTSNRTNTSVTIPLQEGFLLGLTVSSSGAGITRGQCFVRAILARGIASSNLLTQVLLSAYVDGIDFPTWPPGIYEAIRSGQGAIRSITGSTPAAGAEITEVVPTPATWRIMLITYQLTTSAAVASRDSQLIFDDGSHILMQMSTGQFQTATNTLRYSWSPYGGAVGNVNPLIFFPIPPGIFLNSTMRWRTNTNNIQAGDQYTAPQYLVEEWLGG